MMEATQKLEATQVLDFSSALDDGEAQEGIIVGRLVVEGVTHLVSGSEWKNSSIMIMNKKRTAVKKNWHAFITTSSTGAPGTI